MRVQMWLEILGLVIGALATFSAKAADISFTVDDPVVTGSVLFSAVEQNNKILAAFDKHGITGALFVCGKRVDSPAGKALLASWDARQHQIANHSYSHHYLPSKKMTFEAYRDDFLKVEPLISSLANFTKLYRFPYLKEGNTVEKRDGMRAALKQKGYGQGYVTIDASDWYIDERLLEKLKTQPNVDLKPYRDFYLAHMWDRANHYNELSKKVFSKEPKHTLLLHHNLLNALFLDDLMTMFKQKGWRLISSKEAFTDPIFGLEPEVLPAGESIVWAAAKATGKFDSELRYPAEDGVYEKEKMDSLGL
jgi:peptidoglycan-N-acetylglucosamine deacetylase